jgi:hypothetical protein
VRGRHLTTRQTIFFDPNSSAARRVFHQWQEAASITSSG